MNERYDYAAAVEWLRRHGHPSMTRDALRQALRRARMARASGESGEHLLSEPNAPIDGRTPAWTEGALAAWRPLGRGTRTDLRQTH